MNIFPLDHDAWYKARDDRTNRVEGIISEYSNYHIGVIVDPRVENSFSLQCMTLLCCNILARWNRKITIEIPDCKTIICQNKNSDLKVLVKESISQIDPYGEFTFSNVTEDHIDGVLVIGQIEKELKNSFTWINASGWIAGCGYGNTAGILPEQKDCNPIGPSFASCMGTAEIFSRAINQGTSEHFQKWYSLYDFGNTTNDPRILKNPKFCNNCDFGTVHQIGCGAVGSSLDFLISLTDWKGKFFLIDGDTISYSNCNRSLPFTAFDAKDNKNKIDVCSDVMKNEGRETYPIYKSYSRFTTMDEFSKYPPDIVLCLANTENVWSTIQNNFPPIVLHATTTMNWGINFGRHIPKKEWCVMCRFGENIEDTFRPKCEDGVVSIQNGQEILGVLPFLSPAAAVFILAEMAKMYSEHFPVNENFVNASLQPKFGHASLQKTAKKECICNEQSFDLFSKLRKNSKFWKFAEPQL